MRRHLSLFFSTAIIVILIVGCGAGAPSQSSSNTVASSTPVFTSNTPITTPAAADSPQPSARALNPYPVFTPKPLPTSDPTHPLFVDYYLSQHPKIANAITWEPTHANWLKWNNWSPQQKADLRAAFSYAWQWYKGGMVNYAGPAYADPPVNQQYNDANSPWPRTVLDPTTAWNLYLAYVAHSLAADAGNWVPYKLDTLTDSELGYLLDSYRMMAVDSNANDYFDCDYPGGYVITMNMTPCHPTYVFKWMKDNNMIGTDDVDTIGRVLDWSRSNLSHFMGDNFFTNRQYYWPYAGLTPLRMMIEGTKVTDPSMVAAYPDPRHWTQGCGGTSNFLMNVLRVANIPVQVKGCDDGHLVPYFMHQNMYLSHGDDPYDGRSKANPPFPAKLLLIHKSLFDSWFGPGGMTAAKNVGRRPGELLIYYPTDQVLAQYVDDLANNRTHADSKVYNNNYKVGTGYGYLYTFTVQELEMRGLWTSLHAAAIAKGFL